MAGLDVHGVGPAADQQRANDRVLLKMALEHKGYQAARKEVAAEDELKAAASPPNQSPQTQSSSGFAQIQTVEFHGTRIEVAIENGRATLSITHADLQAIRAVVRSTQPHRKDPLVLDLAGTGPDTTGSEGARPFDLQGTGHLAPTSYVKGNSAFLALDRNGNGVVDSGLELFGDQHGASDGFAELARFDANGDGVIDGMDPVYADLRLLFADGRQTSLASQGIARIELRGQPGYELSNGDAVLQQGEAYRSDGTALGAYAMGLQQFDA